jgi:predicted ABC-class ATPase
MSEQIHNGDQTKTLVSLRDYVDALHKEIREDLKDQKEYFEAKIVANDRIYMQRFESGDKAVASALSSADRAVSKAESASEKRFDSVNEFRNTLADQQRTLMPRSESEILFKSLNDKYNSLDKLVSTRQGEKKGEQNVWGYIIGALGILIAIISLVNK